MFQLGKFPPAEQTMTGLKLVRVPFDTGKIRQDLSLFLSQSDRLVGRFKYNRDVLDHGEGRPSARPLPPDSGCRRGLSG